MKNVFCTLALIALTAFPAAAATRIDDPVAFLRTAYAKWTAGERYEVGEDIYTERLAALVALDRKEANGEVPRADDFDFWCNCQDGDIKNVTVKGWSVYGAVPDRQVVEAKFLLEGKRQDILFYFEKTNAGWKLDDVQSLGADAWTLSVICKYGWANGK